MSEKDKAATYSSVLRIGSIALRPVRVDGLKLHVS